MKGLTRNQLEAALNVMGYGQAHGDDPVILGDTMKRVFELYGDDYFVEHDPLHDQWELCNENPVWSEARKGGTIAIRKGHKVR